MDGNKRRQAIIDILKNAENYVNNLLTNIIIVL